MTNNDSKWDDAESEKIGAKTSFSSSSSVAWKAAWILCAILLRQFGVLYSGVNVECRNIFRINCKWKFQFQISANTINLICHRSQMGQRQRIRANHWFTFEWPHTPPTLFRISAKMWNRNFAFFSHLAYFDFHLSSTLKWTRPKIDCLWFIHSLAAKIQHVLLQSCTTTQIVHVSLRANKRKIIFLPMQIIPIQRNHMRASWQDEKTTHVAHK